MWAKAVTADSLSSLFSLASEEAMGGPPASRLSFLSEFWLQMSHFCHILSAKRKKKHKPHLSPNSALLLSETTHSHLPLPRPGCFHCFFREQPRWLHQTPPSLLTAVQRDCDGGEMRFFSFFFFLLSLWYGTSNTVWQLEGDITASWPRYFCCWRTPGCLGDWRNVM